MANAKFNVFHWHITDDDSFPIDIPKYPNLVKNSAFSAGEVYTTDAVKDIVAFAQTLAIRVIPEFDNPGHTRAVALDPYFKEVALCFDKYETWEVPGYGKIKGGPPLSVLDPTKQKTYDLIAAIL